MDLATLIGIIGGISLIFIGIVTGDAGLAAIKNFADAISVIITLGGTLTGLLTSNSISDYINGFKSFKLAIKTIKVDEGEAIKKIISMLN